jgi:hypothetical protein
MGAVGRLQGETGSQAKATIKLTHKLMSAFGSKADIAQTWFDVRF